MRQADKKFGKRKPKGNVLQENERRNVLEVRAKEQTGRYLPTFSHTRSHEVMTAYDSQYYVGGIFQMVEPTMVTYFTAAVTEAYRRGKAAANMKDEVAGQLTAFQAVIDNWLPLCLALMSVYWVKSLLPSVAEVDAVLDWGDGNTGNTVVPNFTEHDFNVLLDQLEGVTIPTIIVEFIKIFNFIININSKYEVGTAEIPPMYVLLWICELSLAECQTLQTNIKTNSGVSQRHMDKFGIKYQKFSREMITGYRIISPDDPDALAWFNHSSYTFRDAAAAQDIYPPGTLADEAENLLLTYYFLNNPNESEIHIFTPFFRPYDANHNIYGGLWALDTQTSTTQNDAGYGIAQNGTEFLCKGVGQLFYVGMLFSALWFQTNIINITITGTDLTGDDDLSNYMISVVRNQKKGTGLSTIIRTNALLGWMEDKLYGGKAAVKDAPIRKGVE